MIGTLLTFFAVGLVTLVVAGIVLSIVGTVFSLTFGLAAFLLFQGRAGTPGRLGPGKGVREGERVAIRCQPQTESGSRANRLHPTLSYELR